MSIITGSCSPRNILHPSTLLDFKYEIGPYYGCEHNCHYCYAHDTEETDWKKEILVHENFAPQLQTEIKGLEKQTIFIGKDTDPYQPIEKKLQHTRQALEILSVNGHAACILTKSDMVVRDIDLLRGMPGSSVGMSFSFQTERSREIFEDNAPANRTRLEALWKIKEAGIETYALVSPVMPLITNIEMQINMLKPVADTIWIYRLEIHSTEDKSWENIENILNKFCPQNLKSFKEITFNKKHQYWSELRKKLEEIKNCEKLALIVEI